MLEDGRSNFQLDVSTLGGEVVIELWLGIGMVEGSSMGGRLKSGNYKLLHINKFGTS